MGNKAQEFGEYQNGNLICSCLMEIDKILYPLSNLTSDTPSNVHLHILFEDGSESVIKLRMDEMSARTIKKIDARIYIPNHGRFDAWLHQKLHEKLEYEKVNGCIREYYVDQSGLHQLPGNGYYYIFGEQLLGEETERVYRDYTVFQTETLKNSNGALCALCQELAFVEPDVLIAVAFLAVALVRSGIQAAGVDWQAVLYIVGKQGVGKTTLARHLTSWLKNSQTGNAATFHGVGSSVAAMRDSMAAARDLPVVVDDLCLSASRTTQRKAVELGAQLIREGTNAASIMKKKPGGHIAEINCQAGLIFTAEFTIDNPSDVTRCIFLNLRESLNLPTTLTAAQMGSALQCYLNWFVSHAEGAFQALQEIAKSEKSDLHPRVHMNYTILKWAMQQLLAAAVADGLSSDTATHLAVQYQIAEQHSIQFQLDKLEELKSHVKEENLASLLLRASKSKEVFHMTKKPKKLAECDGIWWQGDFCLKKEPLERFIRMQNGYQNYTISNITQELKDIGALVLQEEATSQVKIKKGLPRVYRIRISVLESEAKEF